jgi:hypothetical protein
MMKLLGKMPSKTGSQNTFPDELRSIIVGKKCANHCYMLELKRKLFHPTQCALNVATVWPFADVWSVVQDNISVWTVLLHSMKNEIISMFFKHLRFVLIQYRYVYIVHTDTIVYNTHKT